jgi:pyridoxine kinase
LFPPRSIFGAAVNILSIQSHVAYGHVGNSAAAFAMQRLGAEVWPIHTLQLSNHRGYPTARGRAFDAHLIREVMQGLGERGVLGRCDAVLSGYLGTAEIGAAVLDAVAQVKRANPKALYCCDPVIGDVERGVYVAPEVAELMRSRAVPAADLVTPNHFELGVLTGRQASAVADAPAAVEALRALRPRVVLVTSVRDADTPADKIGLLACDPTGRYRLSTPRLPITARGAGDAVAALFLVHYLRTSSAAEALSWAASSVFGILKRTADAGAGEMLLVEAQEELVKPTLMFKPEPL